MQIRLEASRPHRAYYINLYAFMIKADTIQIFYRIKNVVGNCLLFCISFT